MDLNDIRKLVRIMERAELTELEIDDANEGVRVRLRRDGAGGNGDVPTTVQPLVHLVPGGAGAPVAPVPAPAAAADEATLPPGTEAFTSPMVGTFYRSPSPDADSFVDIGATVGEDTVICIIEAMKVMNEIKAEMRGRVVEVLVENGEPVEFGQPLFLIQKT